MSEALEVRSLLAGTFFFSSYVLSIWVPGHNSVPGKKIFFFLILFIFNHNDGILPHIMGFDLFVHFCTWTQCCPW